VSNIIKRDFHGIQIAFEGKEQVSLTDLWKAAGSPASQDVEHWFRNDSTHKFINSVAQKLNTPKSGVLKTKRGKSGGTWAHWQIALSYAQYLSPELHMFVNQCFVDRVQEESNPELAIERGHERAVRQWKKEGRSDEWIAARIRAKIAQKENSKVLQKHGDDSRVFSLCADAMNKQILGKTARQFKEDKNLPERAQTRDYVDAIQLAELELSALVSARRIKESSIYGNKQCENVHEVISGRVHGAVTARGI
jgi:hypothetical protein